MSRLRLRNPQRALVVDRQIDARRNDIDALAFDRHPLGRLQDWHRRVARKQIDHHAVVARVEMLHDDEGRAVDGRQRVQKLPAGVEASGRSADGDDRKILRFAGREGLRYPARSLPLDIMIEPSRHYEIFLEKRRPGRGMSSFRLFPCGEASTIVVAWIAAAERFATIGEIGVMNASMKVEPDLAVFREDLDALKRDVATLGTPHSGRGRRRDNWRIAGGNARGPR